MVVIVDYGLGNIKAFVNIYEQMNIPVKVARNPDELLQAKQIILPGVGAYDSALERLSESGLRDCLDDMVLKKECPVLGICVGMQIMANSSEEGALGGLGWVDAEIKKFKVTNQSGRMVLPHMGWNDVMLERENPLFKGLETGSKFYFLHSYYAFTSNQIDTLSITDYGGPFTSSFGFKNIYGVQFHPEKSHQWGVQLLKNFARI